MKKVILTNYVLPVAVPGGDKEYNVAANLSALICAGALNLDGLKLLEHAAVGKKIKEAAKEGFVLLETAEYNMLKRITELKGFSYNDTELIERIVNAEDVEVAPKETKKK